jgi:hypothetical protein
MNHGTIRPTDELTPLMAQPKRGQGKMTTSARPTTVLADLRSIRASQWAFAATVLAGMAGAPAPAAAAGAYDGIWNVQFITRAGNCSSNSFPFTVSGRQVSSAGGGKVTGGVSRSGAVSVSVSVGASRASGTGRLVGSSGTGRWSGIISGDKCSGVWQASR